MVLLLLLLFFLPIPVCSAVGMESTCTIFTKRKFSVLREHRVNSTQYWIMAIINITDYVG